MYNANPHVPGGAEYDAAQREGGRVLSYEYRFSNEPIAAAKADVLRTQFPRDAKIAWFTVKQTRHAPDT